jgi:hypothetical protein
VMGFSLGKDDKSKNFYNAKLKNFYNVPLSTLADSSSALGKVPDSWLSLLWNSLSTCSIKWTSVRITESQCHTLGRSIFFKVLHARIAKVQHHRSALIYPEDVLKLHSNSFVHRIVTQRSSGRQLKNTGRVKEVSL